MEERHYLQEVLILLVALLLFVPVFQRLRVGSVLAYLVAGAVIGPYGVGLLVDPENTRGLAEFGVVFLLFTIGLELNFERVRLFGKRIYGLAVAQIAVTALVLTACARLLGLGPLEAAAIGGVLALSSTAVVLQLLSERGRMTGQLGRTAIAILLVQDLTVPLMIIFISGHGDASQHFLGSLGIAAFKFIVVVIMIFLVERALLRPTLRLVAGSGVPEVFTGATLLLVLGTGWMTEQAGLSMALGAFLAGMMVADTEFRHQVHADIQPFRGLLLGLFFMTVGMSLDIRYAVAEAKTVALIVIGLLAIKGGVLGALAVIFGLPRDRALRLGGLLAQGSEFAFVLMALAAGAGIVAPENAQLLTVAIGLSMATTPVIALISRRFERPADAGVRSSLGNLEKEEGEIAGHVVVAGFGQVGMAVARFLAGEHVPVLILDMNPKRVSASRARGLRVFYGNATRLDVLRAAHLDRAHALVVALPDPEAAEQVTAVARRTFRELHLFVRAPDEDWAVRFRKIGADAVALDGLTTALELAERVMLVYAPEETE